MVELGDIWDDTQDILTVKYSKDCPLCGEIQDAEVWPKPDERLAETAARAYDKLTQSVANHVAFDCERGDR